MESHGVAEGRLSAMKLVLSILGMSMLSRVNSCGKGTGMRPVGQEQRDEGKKSWNEQRGRGRGKSHMMSFSTAVHREAGSL